MEPINIDEKMLSAINNKTRRKIIKYLIDRPYTITELSHVFNLSVPTIKEHMEKLLNAGIVYTEKSNRKWKYYTLTREGEVIAKSGSKSIPINIILMFVILIGGLFIIYAISYLNPWQTQNLRQIQDFEQAREDTSVISIQKDTLISGNEIGHDEPQTNELRTENISTSTGTIETINNSNNETNKSTT